MVSPFYLDVKSASSVINSLFEKATESLSPSLLNATPLVLLEGGERKKATSAVNSSLETIDSTLTELASLIALTETLRDRVAKLRLLEDDPVNSPHVFLVASRERQMQWNVARHWDKTSVPYGTAAHFCIAIRDQRDRMPWRDVAAKSITIEAQDAKNIRGIYIVDPFVLDALSFSSESLDAFSPKWCSATFNQTPTYSCLEFPPYFLRACSIVLNGLPPQLKPFTSSHLTALYLHRISQDQTEELLRISDLPRLSFLRLKESKFGAPFGRERLPTGPPTVLHSVETLELVFCENKFTHSLPRYVDLPRLASLSVIQDEKDCDQLGASAITPLLECFPLLVRLSLYVLQYIDDGLSSPPKLAKLHTLKIVEHPEQRDTGLTDGNLDDLRLWVQKRLQSSRSDRNPLELHPLGELYLSEDFLGKHRGWLYAGAAMLLEWDGEHIIDLLKDLKTEREAILPPFHIDVQSATSLINTFLGKITASLSPSLLNSTPLFLLNEDERAKARRAIKSSLDTIDTTLAELASLAALVENLRDRVAELRLWVMQPLNGIHTLPEELLGDIFCISVNSSFSSDNEFIGWRMALSIRHTCSWWRTMSLLSVFAPRSGLRGLDISFLLPDRQSRWQDITAKSISIEAQDARNIRGLYLPDPYALDALHFSPESLDAFSPKWCSASFSNTPAYTSMKMPIYFLRAPSIVFIGLPQQVQPLTSSHPTALYLYKTSQQQAKMLLQNSDLPNLSFLRLESLNSHANPSEGNSPTGPAILHSVETLELFYCENEFTQSLSQHFAFPRLTSIYIVQGEKECNELGTSAIKLLLESLPLLCRLSLCVPKLQHALDILHYIDREPERPKLPKLRSLEVTRLHGVHDTGLNESSCGDLKSWVQKRLRLSNSSGVGGDLSTLEELRLSKDFLGTHRDWYEEKLLIFSLCEWSYPTLYQ
ncbi:hypothetical protein DL93DRAFT_2153053 [Clavulina sp. PMI_390]|nr:hypothetical protein DL93DRAFT_2153053 [Clavulina sp. PMI_390]